MSVNDTNPSKSALPYEAPTLTRIPVSATALDDALNSDVTPFRSNTAYPPGGGADS